MDPRIRTMVEAKLVGIDASHDMMHIERVRRIALRIAENEGIQDPAVLLRIEMAAVLHDIEDYKYSGSDEIADSAIRSIMETVGVDKGTQDKISAIIQKVSFHGELASASSSSSSPAVIDIEAACVQDADRLDAIGALGIARCFTYGGAKKRPLYADGEIIKCLSTSSSSSSEATPLTTTTTTTKTTTTTTIATAPTISRDEYMKKQGDTISHFHDKLLHLSKMMKTKSGQAIAHGRHAFMVNFLDQFEDEVYARR